MGSVGSKERILPQLNVTQNGCFGPDGAIMVRTNSETDHWNDSDLQSVVDLMCYFCWALKPCSKFDGAATLIIMPPDHSSHHPPLVFSIIVEPGPDRRVLFYEGEPPTEYERRTTILCPYSLFCYVYRPKGGLLYMTKSVTSLFLRGKVKASSLSHVASFANSFEFTSASWASFYAEKAELQSQGMWPEILAENIGLLELRGKGPQYFSSNHFIRRGKDDLVHEKMVSDPNFGINIKQPTPDTSFKTINWPTIGLKPAVLRLSKALQEGVSSESLTYNIYYSIKEGIVNSNVAESSIQSLEQYSDYDIGDWHGMAIGAQNVLQEEGKGDLDPPSYALQLLSEGEGH